MANDFQHFTPEVWSARVQELRKNSSVGMLICNTEERAQLNHGDRVHRPYHSEVYTSTYTKGTAYTPLDISTTDEYLDVDQTPIIPIYVDKIDKKQNVYPTMDKLSTRSGYEVKDHIDRAVLAEVANAALNGGSAVTLSTSNFVSEISTAKADLFNNGVEIDTPWFAVFDPDTVSITEQILAFNGFKKSDDVLERGYGANSYLGKYLGLEIMQSQNVPSRATLALATQPTDGDTVVINGVTFTFKTVLGSTAGNVLIGANADAARANLAALINTPGTTTAQGVALTQANQAKLKRRGVVATDDSVANTMLVTAAGKMTLSETLTDATDGWGTQTMDLMIGQMGCIDLVMQESVNTEYKDVSGKLGTDIVTWALYGKKTFEEGAQRMFKLTKNV
jgi:hypothetical protein